MRHSHTSTSVCIQSWPGAARISHFPRGPVGTSGQRHRHTHLYTYIQAYTRFPSLLSAHSSRIPRKAAGFLQPPIYCELPPVQAAAGVNTAGDPFYFSLFINYFPSDLLSEKKEKKNHSWLPQLTRKESWHCMPQIESVTKQCISRPNLLSICCVIINRLWRKRERGSDREKIGWGRTI